MTSPVVCGLSADSSRLEIQLHRGHKRTYQGFQMWKGAGWLSQS